MANVLTANFSHTYAGEELINEMFFQPQESVPALSQWYRFIPVKGDKVNVYLPQTLSKILRKYSTCGFSAAGGVTTIVDKTLSVEKIKANLEECVDAWDDTIFAELMKPGVNRDDLSGTLIDNIIRTQYLKAAQSDIHRIAWFADANDADADWNQFDGWITNFVDNSASFETGAFLDLDSDNTNYENSDVLVSNGALNIFRALWAAQSATLRAVPNNMKAFYVTNTFIDNFATTLENQGNSEGQRLIQDGVTTYYFRGVELKAVPEWDTNLADSTNPHYTGSGLSIGSNLVVYAAKDNLVFGSDVSEGSTSFKVRYADDDDETMKLTTKFKLGVQVMHYEYVCIGY